MGTHDSLKAGKMRESTTILSRTASNGVKSKNHHENGVSPKVRNDSLLPVLCKDLTHYRSLLNATPSSFLDGAIVRVVMKNFLTYDYCELSPGPNLNLIIGPNGTGKSSIVCALALGLGGVPSMLGRAKDLTEFVKHGKEKAFVEIELHNNRGSNQIIRRLFTRENHNSTWKLNGSTVNKDQISTIIKKLKIQVDNLCQFLPQDRVVEFAQLKPNELLKETLKAAGEDELFAWLKELIDLRKNEQNFQKQIEVNQEKKEILESKNKRIEAEVVRFKEREKILRKIHLYECWLPFARYSAFKAKYEHERQEKRQIKAEYDRIVAENAPIENRRRMANDKTKQIKEEYEGLINNLQTTVKKSSRNTISIQELEGKSDEYRQHLTNLRKRERQRQKKLQELRNEVSILENKLPSEPPVVDTSYLKSLMEENTNALKENAHELRRLQADQQELIYQSQTLKTDLQRQFARMDKFDNIRNQRLNAFRNDRDLVIAVHWLRANPAKFNKQVYEPIALEVNVTDPQFAGQVEASIGGKLLRTFVCQTEEDFNTFVDELIGKQSLRINAICADKPLSSFQRSVTEQQLNECGFEKCIVDYIDAPDAILSILCAENLVHEIPITRDKVNNSAIEQSRLFKAYYADKQQFVVHYSPYGKHIHCRSCRIEDPRILKDSVDTAEKTEIQNSIRQIRKNQQDLESSMKILAQKDIKLKELDTELRVKKEELDNQRRKLMAEYQDYQRLRVTIDRKRQDMIRLAEEGTQVSQSEMDQISEKLRQVALERSEKATRQKEIALEAMELFGNLITAKLDLINAEKKSEEIEIASREVSEKLKEINIRFRTISAQLEETKKNATETLNEVNQVKESQSENDIEEMQRLANNMNLDEIEEALVMERANAEMTYSTNSEVMQAYSERNREIENLSLSVEKKTLELEKIKLNIIQIKERWEERLYALVNRINENFSAAFSAIGCAGEVRVNQDVDFDQWSIQILVKFRENEKLQLLTGQRQSGGERSVSTIVYLMALQNLSKSPFRVVDEINQGMDPRNERIVHQLLTEAACRLNTSQYFLITPKLLPDLSYHPRMKVHCVFNGEYIPEKLSFTNKR